jgi:hypothetical protein
MPCDWLWADLDDVDPTVASELGLHPTVAIETSKGHFHALWKLTTPLRPENLAKLNRALTYALDADKGGWDLTQVLRIPWTRNFKYPDAPLVQLKWYHPDIVYDPKKVWAKVKGLAPELELTSAGEVTLPRRPIPSRIKQLLRTPAEQVVEGERSDRLWEINKELVKSGFTEDEIFNIVQPCAWNKFDTASKLRADVHRAYLKASREVALNANADARDRSSRDDTRVREDAGRSVLNGGVDDGGDTSRDPFAEIQTHDVFIGRTIKRTRWLIDGIWSDRAQGIIAGEPKTSKSTIALAMAIAVASGKPFLGEYRVKGDGQPVLFVDCETGDYTTQDRMRRIERRMGLVDSDDVVVGDDGMLTLSFAEESGIPLHVLCDKVIDLEQHMGFLYDAVGRIDPTLLVLDPLYLILGTINENQTFSLRPVLNALSKLKNQVGCSVAIVHHYRKESKDNQGARMGQRMSGSWALHGWTESSIFCTAKEDTREGWTRVKMDTEHRRSAARNPIELAWTMDEEDKGLGMDWEINVPQKKAPTKSLSTSVNEAERIVRECGDMGIPMKDLQIELGRKEDAVRRYITNSPKLKARTVNTKSGRVTMVYYG